MISIVELDDSFALDAIKKTTPTETLVQWIAKGNRDY